MVQILGAAFSAQATFTTTDDIEPVEGERLLCATWARKEKRPANRGSGWEGVPMALGLVSHTRVTWMLSEFNMDAIEQIEATVAGRSLYAISCLWARRFRPGPSGDELR